MPGWLWAVDTGLRALLLALATSVLLLVPAVGQAGAPATAPPSPAASPDASVELSAEPMLGGNFRPDSWLAVRVIVENRGPTIDGELRMATPTRRASSTYSQAVQLATGARQEHVLHGRTGAFGERLTISLLSGVSVHASVDLRADANRADTLGVYVLAERPQELVAPIRGAVTAGGRPAPAIIAIRPEDLPPRVEAWSAIDLLVWQDVDADRLDAARLDALRTWTLMGGDLLLLGGSTGISTFHAFPAGMLPYRPAEVVDVPLADLEALVGSTPVGGRRLPALAGSLDQGVALARSGDHLVGSLRRTSSERTYFYSRWLSASAR